MESDRSPRRARRPQAAPRHPAGQALPVPAPASRRAPENEAASTVNTEASPAEDFEPRRYRQMRRIAAIGCLGLLLYSSATYFNWLPGPSGTLDSLILLASSTAMIWSFEAARWRSWAAIFLVLASVVLLVWSLVVFVRLY